MSDKILVRDDTDGLTPTRVHDWFRDHGYYWAVTETIDGFPSYVVTHVATGMAVPFSIDESPEAAKEAYFEGIVEYDQETIDDVISGLEGISNQRICPHCDGEGFIDEVPDATENDEVERLRQQVKRAYTMLDRYANEVSDEAYRWIESALISALEEGDNQ
jgi:hypothetical protein